MRLHRLRWTAVFLSLAAFACDEGEQPPIGPRPFVLSQVSGDNQPGKAGRPLGAPFALRVTNFQGTGVPGLPVTWTVTSGGGEFLEHLGALDDPLGCPSNPVRPVNTVADGFVRVFFMPTWFGRVTVTAKVPSVPDPVTFTTDTSDPAASLVTDEEHLEGKAGEWVDGLPAITHRLAVRLTDGEGSPAPNVVVTWAVTSGNVGLDRVCPAPGGDLASTRTRTRPEDGIASTSVLLNTFGTSTVTATVPGVLGSPVTFTVTVTAVVINLGENLIGGGTGFFGPDLSPDVTVPLGARVEWVNHFESARIVSTAAPPGGAAFDSGVLAQGERFEFVPAISGTWEYADQVGGAAGTLRAQ